MIVCPTPDDEEERLQAVYETKLLDSPLELKFDIAVRYVADLFQVPYAMCTLVAKDRVWLKSVYGFEITEIPRDLSICGHAICEVSSSVPSARIIEVPDLKKDVRFCHNNLLLKDLNINSYLGFVLRSQNLKNIGTLSLMDAKRRLFTHEEKNLLAKYGMYFENLTRTKII